MGDIRSRIVLVALAIVVVAGYPSLADTPESGTDPSATLTVTPSDALSDGQTVTVTGSGFPPSTGGVIRQCGGSAADPQCDVGLVVPFVTTATGDIPPTPVTVRRIVNTGTTTFNCGIQYCALVATAGGMSSQHHVRMAGAGTVVPTSTPPPPTTIRPPPTTIPPLPTGNPICDALAVVLESFPFLRELLASLFTLLGCAPGT